MKQLLVFFHGGCLSLSTKIYIGFDLIDLTIGLAKVGVDPTPFFAIKEHDKNIIAWTKEKYNLTQDKRGFDIASINDKVVWFMAKVMSSKLLQKMQLNQCTAGVIVAAK